MSDLIWATMEWSLLVLEIACIELRESVKMVASKWFVLCTICTASNIASNSAVYMEALPGILFDIEAAEE